MNAAETLAPEPGTIAPKKSDAAPFLQRADWLSFAITTLMILVVYLFTLNPSLDLRNSGIHATGAMYLGVPDVPGFPVWTIYAWLFTVLLPISNIAWRVNVASAVASSLVCGMVALLTSRGGGALLNDLLDFKRLEVKDEKRLRLVCGCVAGMAFGLDGAFWREAVIADPWTFSLLLFTITVALFLLWQHSPEKTRWFHAAVFMYGVTLSNSQALAAAAPGIECFILCAKPSLARDVFAATTVLLASLVAGKYFDFLPSIASVTQVSAMFRVYAWIGFFTLIVTLILGLNTRAFFTHWRTVSAATLLFGLGLTPYLLLPIFSVTNPPMNWGYPRTVEGFFNLISRGQMEQVYPVDNFSRFGTDLWIYVMLFKRDFGLIYAAAALIPFVALRRIQKLHRQWLLGLLGFFISLSLFMLYLINPSEDRGSMDLLAMFFTPSHLILAILAGCGLTLLGLFVTAPAKQTKPWRYK